MHFTEDTLAVDLADGRTIIVPLAWYPRLLDATIAQRSRWKVAGAGYGIHWPDLDEDLSAEGLLRGAPLPPSQGTCAARLAEHLSGSCQSHHHTPDRREPIPAPADGVPVE